MGIENAIKLTDGQYVAGTAVARLDVYVVGIAPLKVKSEIQLGGWMGADTDLKPPSHPIPYHSTNGNTALGCQTCQLIGLSGTASYTQILGKKNLPPFRIQSKTKQCSLLLPLRPVRVAMPRTFRLLLWRLVLWTKGYHF